MQSITLSEAALALLRSPSKVEADTSMIRIVTPIANWREPGSCTQFQASRADRNTYSAGPMMVGPGDSSLLGLEHAGIEIDLPDMADSAAVTLIRIEGRA